MAPPDGSRVSRIPTLSWDSVVDTDDDTEVDTEVDIEIDIDDGTGDGTDETVTPTEPPAPIEPIEPIGFVPLSLDLTPSAHPVPSPPAVTPPRAAPVAPSVSLASPSVDAPSPADDAPSPVVDTPSPVVDTPSPVADALSPAVDTDEPMVRTARPTAIVPVIGGVPAGAEPLAQPADGDALPPIREATPAPEPSGPLLPSAAAGQRPPTTSNFEFDPASVAPAPARQPMRRKRRGGLKLVATIVVLGGLVAAALVFGQPYLFPGDWDDATAPYAEAVESASGVEFVEPLTINALPAADFATRLTAELAPASPQAVSQWRALGLATGAIDEPTLSRQLAGWRDVVYSTDDGQVYHDASAAGPALDAQLVHAMAAASLDQQYLWSSAQPEHTLDEAAEASAEVIRQARAIQRSSDFAGAEPVSSLPLDGLPSIVGYQLLAPYVLAEFPTEAPAAGEPNPLAALASSPRAPAGDTAPVPSSLPVMAEGDVMTESPIPQDRAFWFLVFAGFLDGPTSFAASEAVVENSLAHATRGATDCVYATFSGGGVDQTATLRSALTAWSELAPPELASSVTALADGSLQLSSCDPGPALEAPLRTTATSELIAYRALELATAEAVAERDGGDPEFEFMWGLIAPSAIPSDVASAAAGAAPGEIASTASDAVAGLYELAG